MVKFCTNGYPSHPANAMQLRVCCDVSALSQKVHHLYCGAIHAIRSVQVWLRCRLVSQGRTVCMLVLHILVASTNFLVIFFRIVLMELGSLVVQGTGTVGLVSTACTVIKSTHTCLALREDSVG